MEYKNNLPGETVYDKPRVEEEPVAEKVEPTVVTEEQKTPDIYRYLALASFITSISSLIIMFLIPFFGLAFAAVGGVFGIVFGAISRKKYKTVAWTGIIISILVLAMVLLCFIVLCIAGWGLLLSLASQFSQGFGSPGIYFR